MIRAKTSKFLPLGILLSLLLLAGFLMPTQAAPAYIVSQQTGTTATVNTGALNVRSGPSVVYNVVTVIGQGSTVTLWGRNNDSSWVYIRTSGNLEGWVNSSLLNTSASLSALPVTTSSVPSVTPLATISTGALNVRTGPGVNYGIVTTVSFGQSVALIGRTSNNVWVNIQVGNQTGWVNGSYITPNVAISSLPLTAVPAQPDPAVPVAPNALLSLRAGPSYSDSVVGHVFQGQRVTAVARNSNNLWIKIRINETGLLGWIPASNVQLNITITNLPVESGTVPVPTATPIPATTTATPVPTTTSATATPTVAPTSSTGVSGVVATGALNVRTGPGPEYSVVTFVNQGSTLTITGRNSDNSWLQVITSSNQTGWVLSSLVTVTGDVNALPIVNVDSQTATGTVSTGALNMRSGPGVEYGVTAVLNQGTTVTLLGRNTASTWVKVQLSNNQVGWLNATFLNTNVTVSDLPLTS